MKFLNPNYEKLYALYKKLPSIASIILAALFFIWSIIDISAFSYSSYYYGDSYGIMGLDSAFLALFIWWAIGAILSFATWFFSALAISPTIARTDATIEIKEHIKNN